MSMLPRILLIALLVTQAVTAADDVAVVPGPAEPAPPSAASIKELLTVTDARKLVDGVPVQVQSAMQATVRQAVAAPAITPEQQKVLDDLGTKVTALFQEDMNWEVLEPLFIAAYTNTFTQPEIDGLLTFYRSSPGQAVITKMPLVMQQTMEMIQGRITALRPKLQQLQQAALEQLTTHGSE